jgi:HK97 gp10 family phage protein
MAKTGISWGGSLNRLKQLFKDTSKDVEDEIDKAIASEVKKITHDAKRRTPVRTGRAKRGWQNKKLKKSEYEIRNRVSYIRFLEFGTRRIRPRRMLDLSLRAGRARLRRSIKKIMNKQKRRWS